MLSPQQTEQLAVCLKLLSTFGEAGQIVWELGKWYVGELVSEVDETNGYQLYKRNKYPITQDERIEYLKEAIQWLKKQATDKKIVWRRVPVDFRTFVDSPRLLNKPHVLWPAVIKEGQDINSGKYVEAVLTGAIGTAKTTLAIYTQTYQVYVLSCMDSPHEVFDLDPSSEILIVLQSINKNLSQDVDYKRMRDMIANSPYFLEFFPFQKDRESDLRFPRNIMVKPVAGHDQAAIGQNVIGGILDEVNFMAVVEKSKQSSDGGVYDQAKQNYDAIARRRESRFMQLGELPGMLCLVSSRKYPGQFTDQRELAAQSNPRIKIYDKRLWELRPERFAFFNGEVPKHVKEMWGDDCEPIFWVFIGDVTHKPRVFEPGEDRSAFPEDKIRWVPIEYRAQFKEDIMGALRDVLGVATQALHPFMMDTDAIAASFGKCLQIISRERCNLVDELVQAYPKRFVRPEEPRFVHIDLSISRDSSGVAIAWVPEFKECFRGDVNELMPVIQYDMILEVPPPKGGEIDFAAIRRLLYGLRKMGLNLKWATTDDFQSFEMIRVLRQQGFIVGKQSMDIDTMAYDALRQAIYDGRVNAPKHDRAQIELVRLELDPKDGSIDHPPNGSKDCSDAMAGVCYGLTMQREIWTRHRVSARSMPYIFQNKGPKPQDPKFAGTGLAAIRHQRSQGRLIDRKVEEMVHGKGGLIIRDEPGRTGR